MTAIEDPAAQPRSAAAGSDQPSDDLEDWLSDLRTEVAADPTKWINEEPAGEHPTGQVADRNPPPPGARGTEPRGTGASAPGAPESGGGGRHRAPE